MVTEQTNENPLVLNTKMDLKDQGLESKYLFPHAF